MNVSCHISRDCRKINNCLKSLRSLDVSWLFPQCAAFSNCITKNESRQTKARLTPNLIAKIFLRKRDPYLSFPVFSILSKQLESLKALRMLLKGGGELCFSNETTGRERGAPGRGRTTNASALFRTD